MQQVAFWCSFARIGGVCHEGICSCIAFEYDACTRRYHTSFRIEPIDGYFIGCDCSYDACCKPRWKFERIAAIVCGKSAGRHGQRNGTFAVTVLLVEVGYAVLNPLSGITDVVTDIGTPQCVFARVGTALLEEAVIVCKTLAETVGLEPCAAQFGIAVGECVFPVERGKFAKTGEVGQLSMFVSPKEIIVCVVFFIIGGVGNVRRTFPATTPSPVKVPYCHTDFFLFCETFVEFFGRGVAVVGVIVHILAVVVGGEEEFNEEVIVVEDGFVEVVGKTIHKLLVGTCRHEVYGFPDRFVVEGFTVFHVGVFSFIAAP